jgi:uncharacterized protein DUF6916
MIGRSGFREYGRVSKVLTLDDFAQHVGKALRLEGYVHPLFLTAIDQRLEWKPPAGMRTPFTLVLRGPREHRLSEGLRRCQIEGGPHCDLYIIPTHSPGTDHQLYHVVFN